MRRTPGSSSGRTRCGSTASRSDCPRSLDGREPPLRRCRASLEVEDLPGSVEQAPRLVGTVGDRRDADHPVPTEGRHHVEDRPGLARVVEMDPVSNRELEDVVRPEHSVGLGLEVIGRHEELPSSARRDEAGALGVVLALREELQGQVGMRGAALSQVQLDRVGLPAVLGARREEVDGETAEDASFGERFSRPYSSLAGKTDPRKSWPLAPPSS